MDISLDLEFHHKKNNACIALGIKRNWQKTAVLETVLIIFLRNDCKMDDEFHGLVLVMYSLDLIASSAKVNSNSLQ